MGKIKTIGILTSGGDAPGMNAAIRAVTRSGIYNQFNIKGIYRGYEGLVHDEVKPFTTEDVSGIITRGGTILKTARSKEFMTPEGMQKAYETCQKEEIDALVVIGGNGSLTGAWKFGVEFDFPVIGLPGTIDNDLYGTHHEHHHGVCGPHPRYRQLARAHLLHRGDGPRCRLFGTEQRHRLWCRGCHCS